MQTTTMVISTDTNVKMHHKEFQKMVFIHNAIEDGWTVKKMNEDSYVFTKKHENRRQVFQKEYLENFIEHNQELRDPGLCEIV
jgi:hypothetical protein